MATEIKEGRGAGPHGDYLLLKLDHLGPEVIENASRESARSRRNSPTSTR